MQGRPKLIDSPEKMWQLFLSYKIWAKSNPILVQDFVGKDGNEVDRKRERPLTMEGFECYVMDNTDVTYPDLTNYFEAKSEGFRSFIPICTRIRRAIRSDQISGGMAGIYNPSITQRLNNLVEKVQEDGTKQVTIKVKYESKGIGSDSEQSTSGAIEGTERT